MIPYSGPSESTKKASFCFNKPIPSCCNGSASFLKVFRVLQGRGSQRGQPECDPVVMSSRSSQQGVCLVQAPNRTGPGSLPGPTRQSDPGEGEPGARGGSGRLGQQSQACGHPLLHWPRQRACPRAEPEKGSQSTKHREYCSVPAEPRSSPCLG
uniref:Uncharacterized protein n=1 Tax=Pipistrellus kuhlii TaxID=59472 RepID=A0A7J7V0E4_PIPKU|nr:hypothetical protein mPipKuh1_008643 [Pipistrellus kuhlii]